MIVSLCFLFLTMMCVQLSEYAANGESFAFSLGVFV